MLSRDFLLDNPGTEGANAFKGDAVEDTASAALCDWFFGGYALPLLDPSENHTRGTAQSTSCESGWTGYLGSHVSTTSTSTVFIREAESWRIYIQDPSLVADDSATASGFPSTNAAVSAVERFPAGTEWEASGRFEQGYIAFVQSPDGGLSFPVYAPIVIPYKFYEKSGSCVQFFYDSFFSSVDWTNAGWTPTAIQCDNTDTTYVAMDTTDNVYVTYRDVSVVDLFVEMGVYLMFAIECRSMTPVESGGCDPCTTACDTSNTLPYTRVVVFASTSPDFPRDDEDAVGPFLWPNPLYHSQAMVLVAPEVGGDGPAVGADPNEWFGVPCAVRGPECDVVLLYVPWTGAAATKTAATLPTRVTGLYGGMPEWKGGAAATSGGGISTFRLSGRPLALLLWWIVYADRNGSSYGGKTSAELRAILQTYLTLTYQGEVLVTDGTAASSGIPTSLSPVDPHAVRCGECSNQLWMYWAQNSTGTAGSDKSQVRRAVNIGAENLELSLQASVSVNGAYTLFHTTDCETVVDVRYLFTTTASAYLPSVDLVADPDVVVLPSGRVRCSFFSDPAATTDGAFAAQFGGGLVCAWGPTTMCEAVSFPRYYDFAPAPPSPPAPASPRPLDPERELSALLGVPLPPNLRSRDRILDFLESLGGPIPGFDPRQDALAAVPKSPDGVDPLLAAVSRLAARPAHARVAAAAGRLVARCG